MEDLWKRIGRDSDRIRFHQQTSFGPYSEIGSGGIREEDGVTQISMNCFYRYDRVMHPLLANCNISEKHRAWILDLYMHYLTQLEFRKGVTGQEYRTRVLWEEIETGAYGEEIAKLFLGLVPEEQYLVANALEKQKRIGESVMLFSDTLVDVLKNGVVYKDKWKEKELYLYLNEEKMVERTEKITLIERLFLPLDYELRVFWGDHFAVLGEEQTMVTDEIMLI